jgi:hypothetical protein
MKHNPIVPCTLKEIHTANGGFLSLLSLIELTVHINHIHTTVTAYVTRYPWLYSCEIVG